MKYSMSYVNKMAKVLGDHLEISEIKEVLKPCEKLTASQAKSKRASVMLEVMDNLTDKLTDDSLKQIRKRTACRPIKFNKLIKKILTLSPDQRLSALEATNVAGRVSIIGSTYQVAFKTKTCFCGMMAKATSPVPLSWCYCCSGHVKWLYEKALDKSFHVEVVDNVFIGEDCVFNLEEKI